MPASDWEVRLSNSRGVPYFYNKTTKQSLWEAPTELKAAEIDQLPGADLLNEVKAPAVPAGSVRASHLLVKHRDSRRPASWKEENITRTVDEAIAILRGYQAQIGGDPETFAQLAQQHSDCSSHAKGGDLGVFQKGMMQRPFEEATFALEVGKMSDVVKTDSGVHLILRTG